MGKRESPINWWDRGSSAWGIQTGQLAACRANFVNVFFHHPGLYTGAPFSYYPRELKMRKRNSPKNGWDTGVSVPGAFKLDNLQPVELILSMYFSIILVFILGLPFHITPESWKWEKGIHPKMDETQKFLYFKTGPYAACWADCVPQLFQIGHISWMTLYPWTGATVAPFYATDSGRMPDVFSRPNK